MTSKEHMTKDNNSTKSNARVTSNRNAVARFDRSVFIHIKRDIKGNILTSDQSNGFFNSPVEVHANNR